MPCDLKSLNMSSASYFMASAFWELIARKVYESPYYEKTWNSNEIICVGTLLVILEAGFLLEK